MRLHHGTDFGITNTGRHYKIPQTAYMDLPDGDWCIGLLMDSFSNGTNSFQYAISAGTVLVSNSYNIYAYQGTFEWRAAIFDSSGIDMFDGEELPLTSQSLGYMTQLLVVQRNGTNAQIYLCRPGQTARLEKDITLPVGFGAVSPSTDLYIGCREDLSTTRAWTYNLGMVFKCNASLTATQIEAIASGEGRPSDYITEDIFLFMNGHDATITDEANSLVATRYGSGWLERPYSLFPHSKPGPQAAFLVDHIKMEASHTFSFTNYSFGETSWDWDFGDTNTSSLENPTHQYSSSGTYRVKLTVTDGNGDTCFTYKDIEVITSTADSFIEMAERCNIDPATSTIDNPGTSTPDFHLKEYFNGKGETFYATMSHNQWFCKINHVNTKTPTFDFHLTDPENLTAEIWQAGAFFSYDLQNWTLFDNYVIDTSLGYDALRFSHNTSFTQDTVYIGWTPTFTPSSIRDRVASIDSSSYVYEQPSAIAFDAHKHLSGVDIHTCGQIDDFSATPPFDGRELWSFRIEDTSRSPSTAGKEKMHVVMTSGAHPNEEPGMHLFWGIVDFLLSEDTIAQDARSECIFHCYPMTNPTGKWRALKRSSDYYEDDYNRMMGGSDSGSLDGTGVQQVFKAALTLDTGDSYKVFIDWHGDSSDAGYYYNIYDDIPIYSTFVSYLTSAATTQGIVINSSVHTSTTTPHPGAFYDYGFYDGGAPIVTSSEIGTGYLDIETRATKNGTAYAEALTNIAPSLQEDSSSGSQVFALNSSIYLSVSDLSLHFVLLLVEPVENETGVGLPTTFEWSSHPDATIYFLEIATDAGFTSVIDSTWTTQLTYESSVLSGAETYYWRVRAAI